MVDASTTAPPGGSNAAQLQVAQQMLIALGNIAKALGNSGIPGSTSTTAGAASGLYMNVTANGQAYKIALLNPS